ELAAHRALQKAEGLAALRAAKEADRMLGRAVDAEDRRGCDVVGGAQERAVTADGDDEVEVLVVEGIAGAQLHRDARAHALERVADLLDGALVRFVRGA